MQIIYNGLTEEKNSSDYTCNICNSVIRVSNGELFTGYLGDRYFKCPVCGKYTMAVSPNNYQKAEDVVYPFSFRNYIGEYTPSHCTDADINKLIQDVFKDGFDTVEMNMAEFGDTMVLAIKDDFDDNGKPVYQLYVCKNVDTTACTKD